MPCFKIGPVCFIQITHSRFINNRRERTLLTRRLVSLQGKWIYRSSWRFTLHLSVVPLVQWLDWRCAVLRLQKLQVWLHASAAVPRILNCVAVKARAKCGMQIEKWPNTSTSENGFWVRRRTSLVMLGNCAWCGECYLGQSHHCRFLIRPHMIILLFKRLVLYA